MKIVLIGKNGQLGWEFQRTLPALGEVIALGRNDLDVSDLRAVQMTLTDFKPDIIINTSAYTDVDGAEKNFEMATRINSDAPGLMAETARTLHAAFIHYSTDYVFDGRNQRPYTEDDPVNPLNAYGRTKLMGEEQIRQAGEAYLILRTSWVYSLRGNSFVNKVLGWARKYPTLRIVSDQIGSPTWAGMLAEVTTQALIANQAALLDVLQARRGIYHVAGGGYTSRYQWAREILACDSKPTEQLVRAIEPALTADFPTPAVRPLFSALDCSKFKSIFGLSLPDWQGSLRIAMAS